MPAENEVKISKNFRSLTTTLVIILITLNAVILTVTGGLNLYFNITTQQKLIAEQQHRITYGAADTVAGFIKEKFDALEGAVGKKRLQSVNQEERKQVLSELLGGGSAFRQIVLLNAQEQELAMISRLSSIVSGKFKERAGSDMFSQVSQKQTYISQVYVDEVTQEPMVVMAVPIKDVFGDFKGILMAEVDLKFMWDLVGSIKVGEKGLTYVVDRKGNLIAFKDISRVLGGENLGYLKEVDRYIKGDAPTHKDNTDIVKGIRGTWVVTNHAHLGRPDWAVVIELPILEAYQPVIYQSILLISTMLIIFGLAIVAIFSLSKSITKPIKELTATVQTITGGDLTKRAEIKSKDEIGQLAASFNEMVEDVISAEKEKMALAEKYTKGLEETVAERTQELQKKMEELKGFNKLAVDRELKMIELKNRIKELENKGAPNG